MRYIIEEHQFRHVVDWDFFNTEEGGFVEEYFPDVKESIESFLRLLENVYSKDAIADALAEGLDAMDYSEKGKKARQLLETME